MNKNEKIIHCKICSKQMGTMWGTDVCQECQKGLDAFTNSSVRLQKAINYLIDKEEEK